jgi:flagellar hook protein FlgE
MQRSLSTGVSGMVNHQMILDTVANNLANVSTTGFKSSRVSFATALNQTGYAGSAPSGSTGGRNPVQVGLGVQNSSMDVNMSQGALESTGRTMDLALQGEGFFQLAKVDAGGNVTGQVYTRVGNFGFDSYNNLVDLSTGLKVLGKQTDSEGVTIGQQTAIDLTTAKAMDAVATQNITYQGNLSSAAGALQGTSLKSVFPLTEVDQSNNSTTADENTTLSHLSAFNTDNYDAFTTPTSGATKTIYVYGTKPDGSAYASTFTLNPWSEKVSDLITKVNSALTQGNDSFGLMSISNGTLKVDSIGSGSSFSFFMGERNPISGVTTNFATSSGAAANLTTTNVDITTALPAYYPAAAHTVLSNEVGALDSTFTMPAGTYSNSVTVQAIVNNAVAASVTLDPGVYAANQTMSFTSYPSLSEGDTIQFKVIGASTPTGTATGMDITSTIHGLSEATGTNYSGSGVTKVFGSYTISGTSSSTEAGLLQPSFTLPAGTYGTGSSTLKITVKVNGKEVGSLTPSGTFAAPTAFSLSSFPHVKIGDVVTYEIAGNQAIAGMTYDTGNVSDQSSSNLTADLNLDGIPDMFQEGSTTDVNAWQYEKTTNSTINWYKFRMAPDVVSTSIQVYDKNGGSHIMEARFLRTGTRAVTSGNSTNRYNGWDMLLSVKPEDGMLNDDVVSGLQFDQQGRFYGIANLGSTMHGTSLSDSSVYVGTPVDNSITVNWATTGTATMKLDLGNANSTTGLTGFGTASTAASINQDGNANGELQTLSVSSNGNIVGLYSNGKSLPLYQLQIATFSNPAGMTNVGTNLWTVSANSGDPIVRQPGSAGSATVTSGALEGSNVDIASEFTRLITAQRGFQVNARVIQTTDSMLQELATLIR